MATVLTIPPGRVGTIRVSTRAMGPILAIGDMILFHRQPEMIRRGSIVVFYNGIRRAVWVEPKVAVWELSDASARWPIRRAWSEVDGVAFARLRSGEWLELAPSSAWKMLGTACRGVLNSGVAPECSESARLASPSRRR